MFIGKSVDHALYSIQFAIQLPVDFRLEYLKEQNIFLLCFRISLITWKNTPAGALTSWRDIQSLLKREQTSSWAMPNRSGNIEILFVLMFLILLVTCACTHVRSHRQIFSMYYVFYVLLCNYCVTYLLFFYYYYLLTAFILYIWVVVAWFVGNWTKKQRFLFSSTGQNLEGVRVGGRSACSTHEHGTCPQMLT